MSVLAISGLNKTYFRSDISKCIVFDNFSLEIECNNIVAIVGANGCGKTSLLGCIAGLVPYEKGSISIDGENCFDNVGFVFQNYRESLLPWLKNIDNVACSLEQPTLSKSQKHDYIKRWAIDRNIILPWDAYPYQCSGGQQQLLVLVRELINQPKLLLMDEPFTALDYEKRLAWRLRLETLWKKKPTTVILVSHDVEEAIYLADEVIVIGNQPAKIISRHVIEIPHPRIPSLLQSEIFYKNYRAITQSFLQANPII